MVPVTDSVRWGVYPDTTVGIVALDFRGSNLEWCSAPTFTPKHIAAGVRDTAIGAADTNVEGLLVFSVPLSAPGEVVAIITITGVGGRVGNSANFRAG